MFAAFTKKQLKEGILPQMIANSFGATLRLYRQILTLRSTRIFVPRCYTAPRLPENPGMAGRCFWPLNLIVLQNSISIPSPYGRWLIVILIVDSNNPHQTRVATIHHHNILPKWTQWQKWPSFFTATSLIVYNTFWILLTYSSFLGRHSGTSVSGNETSQTFRPHDGCAKVPFLFCDWPVRLLYWSLPAMIYMG